MVKIITEPAHTFSEYSLLPGLTKRDTKIQNISLSANLAGLGLKIPFLSAAMTSVTNFEMALALGKEGGLGVLPARLSVAEQVEIVKKIKSYEMGFVEESITIRENESIEKVLRYIEVHGHSKIPIVDRNNIFLGMFTLKHYWNTYSIKQPSLHEAMIKLEDVPFVMDKDITIEKAKKVLKEKNVHYLVVLDDQKRLVQLAFEKDIEKIKVGAAVSTHEGWQERVDANINAGVDLIVIDTSDAYNEFTKDVLTEYKSRNFNVPICVGNVVTRDGALFLMECGADIVKVGMSSGSICTTQREKAVGRAPMTALIEAAKARDSFSKGGKYVPVIMDGGVATPADMIIALTISDGLMMGGYFNKFYEAAGDKYDENGKPTNLEEKMRYVATWGEGSERARNLERYGQTRKTFFPEGVDGFVPYSGRLKPTLKKDLMKIQAAMSNAGCMDLSEFKDKTVIELMSPQSLGIVSNSHNVIEEMKHVLK